MPLPPKPPVRKESNQNESETIIKLQNHIQELK